MTTLVVNVGHLDGMNKAGCSSSGAHNRAQWAGSEVVVEYVRQANNELSNANEERLCSS